MLRNIALTAAAAGLAFSLFACTGAEEIDNKPVAEVVEVKPEPKPEPKPTGTPVAVDAANSRIEWLGAKVTRTHDGGFKTFDGKILMDGDTPVGTEFTIDLSSLWTDTEKLTAHLQDTDFFDVATYNTATFTSTDIKPAEAEGATHSVTGELDLHGVKKAVTFPATITVAADKITAAAEFQINRQDWAISFPGKPDDLIKDEVAIKLNLAFPRPAEAGAEGDAAGDAAGQAPAGAPKPAGVGAKPAGDMDKKAVAPPAGGVQKAPAPAPVKASPGAAPAKNTASQGGAKK
ncbi:MAG: YceI family protein [Alphaproteobacteria bacterium]|nr:YceI family protein [Alphaproteobacteria bacterium]